MNTAKIFTNGRSQAVRLPKKYRFKSKEVFIRKFGNGILLLPDEQSWEEWFNVLQKYPKNLFPERDQPENSDIREFLP